MNAVERWRKKNPDRWKRLQLKSRLKREYGISLDFYDGMYVAQGGKCAICHQPNELHVDHDHATGKVRGLLCGPCNRALGQFKDDPTRLRRAAEYLQINHSDP